MKTQEYNTRAAARHAAKVAGVPAPKRAAINGKWCVVIPELKADATEPKADAADKNEEVWPKFTEVWKRKDGTSVVVDDMHPLHAKAALNVLLKTLRKRKASADRFGL